MIHRRRALEDYGNIVVSFRKTNQIKDVPGPLYHAEVVAASAAKVSSIVDRLAAAFPQMSEAFKTNWKAWADSWLLPGKVSSSSSSTYAEGVEWDRLVAMGANIIPSVVQELSDRYNFFGCSLCECSPPPSSSHKHNDSVGETEILCARARYMLLTGRDPIR